MQTARKVSVQFNRVQDKIKKQTAKAIILTEK